MLTMIINLIYINIIMAFIYHSGFFEKMDEYINNKYPLRHLPYPFHCAYCGTWWMSLLYVIISGNLSLLSVALCLASAELSEIVIGIWILMKSAVMKVVGILMKWIG